MAESIPSLSKRKGLKLPVHGNERTMNLNHLILANITESAYFRVDLAQFKQFDQLVDEIYYRVTHLEPWVKFLPSGRSACIYNIVTSHALPPAEGMLFKVNLCQA